MHTPSNRAIVVKSYLLNSLHVFVLNGLMWVMFTKIVNGRFMNHKVIAPYNDWPHC